MLYMMYFATRGYKEELELAWLNADTEEKAAAEYLQGYKLNNYGQPDDILDLIEDGDGWIEARRYRP